MTEFTPFQSALGGALIGLAAVLLMATTGRIAGVSGHLSRLLPPYEDRDWRLRAAFIGGLALAPWLYQFATSVHIQVVATADIGLLIVAGLLVGFGTVIGSGCTSGHGVCGLARLSRRSLVATATFMTTAVLTVFVTRHLVGA